MGKEYIEALKSYDKIDNTLCLNNNRNNIEFAISEDENLDCKNAYEMVECLDNIKQALVKAQENEMYVIYCVNNYHNVYMDYRGEPCNYSDATLFKDKFEAHQFLRNNHRNNYYIWAVVNNKDLSDEEKRRID